MAGLGSYPAAAVLRAENLDRATKFYTDVLGYTLDKEMSGNGLAMFTAGKGSMFTVYERPGMPAPENTTLAIPVGADEFDAVMDDLRAKGVKFEEYDIPQMDIKTVNGVAEYPGGKTSWFKDSEGNILNLVTM